MAPIDESTRRALERLINDDLEHAVIMSACVTILDDGQIVVDELALRLEDGRLVAIDVSPEGDAREMVLEIHDDYSAGPPVVLSGWRRATVMKDYRQELADAIADLNGGDQ